MRKIIKIAAAELKTMFYSPIAWMVLIIFVVQCGLTFFEISNGLRKNFMLGAPMSMLTAEVFTGPFGLFTKAQENLYLYFPLLTMGLVSREISSGSIKLLLSSPIKISNIILGKYLAIVLYSLMLTGILLIYSIAAGLIIKSVDYTLLLSGMLGLFLLMCTFSAIGLFLSCLSSYQVVAAICTLAVLAALQYVSRIGQDIDYIRDITNFLFISSKANAMITGMITSREVIYFLLMMVLFLGFSIFRLQSAREFKPVLYVAAKYLALIVIVLSLGYLSTRQRLVYYKDMTATNLLTISEESQAITAKIKGPLTVTTYVNLLNANARLALPMARTDDYRNMEGFMRFIPGLEMKYVYYYAYSSEAGVSVNFIKDPSADLSKGAKRLADSMSLDFKLFMPPAELKKQIDLSSEDYRLIRQLEYNGKKSFVRFYNDMIYVPNEPEIASSLKRLIQKSPIIGFSTGHGERSANRNGDRDYSNIISRKDYRTTLVNNGFDIQEINLKDQEIPEGLAVLVLSDPTTALSISEQQKLNTYIGKGGNVLFMAEPGSQQLMNPLLESIGLKLKPGMLLKASAGNAPSQMDASFGSQSAVVDTLFRSLFHYQVSVPISNASVLSVSKGSGFKANTILTSPEGSWLSTKSIDVADSAQFDLAAGDAKGNFPIMVSLTRNINGKEQRILVSGDADLISNAALMRHSPATPLLANGIFRWFSYEQFPITMSRPPARDNAILVNRRQFRLIKSIILWGVPVLLISVAGLLLISRKRK